VCVGDEREGRRGGEGAVCGPRADARPAPQIEDQQKPVTDKSDDTEGEESDEEKDKSPHEPSPEMVVIIYIYIYIYNTCRERDSRERERDRKRIRGLACLSVIFLDVVSTNMLPLSFHTKMDRYINVSRAYRCTCARAREREREREREPETCNKLRSNPRAREKGRKQLHVGRMTGLADILPYCLAVRDRNGWRGREREGAGGGGERGAGRGRERKRARAREAV
jgi:hypothetical protein